MFPVIEIDIHSKFSIKTQKSKYTLNKPIIGSSKKIFFAFPESNSKLFIKLELIIVKLLLLK